MRMQILYVGKFYRKRETLVVWLKGSLCINRMRHYHILFLFTWQNRLTVVLTPSVSHGTAMASAAALAPILALSASTACAGARARFHLAERGPTREGAAVTAAPSPPSCGAGVATVGGCRTANCIWRQKKKQFQHEEFGYEDSDCETWLDGM